MVKDSRTFKSQTLAREFLDGEGFKVNSSTFSRHARAGYIGENAEGEFEADALLAYARQRLKRKESGKTVSAEEKERMDAKSRAELDLLEAKAARERIKQRREEGGIIELEDHLNDLAARMAFFSLQLDGYAVQQAEASVDVLVGKRLDGVEKIIALVDGDPGKARDLAAYFERQVPELSEVCLVKKQQWLQAFSRERVFVVDLDEAVGDADVQA